MPGSVLCFVAVGLEQRKVYWSMWSRVVITSLISKIFPPHICIPLAAFYSGTESTTVDAVGSVPTATSIKGGQRRVFVVPLPFTRCTVTACGVGRGDFWMCATTIYFEKKQMRKD